MTQTVSALAPTAVPTERRQHFALPHPHHPHLHLHHRVSAVDWAEIHRLRHQEGLGIGAIARGLHLPRRTIRRILAPWD